MRIPIQVTDVRYRHFTFEEQSEAIFLIEKELESLLGTPFYRDHAHRLIAVRSAILAIKCGIVDARHQKAKLLAMIDAKKAQMGLFDPGEPVGKTSCRWEAMLPSMEPF